MNQPLKKFNYAIQRIIASILALTLFVFLLPSSVFAQSENQRISAVINDSSKGLISITPDPPIYTNSYFETPKTYRIKVENIVGFDWVVYSTGAWIAINYNITGQVQAKLVSTELILPFQESGNEKVTLSPHSSAYYDVTFNGPGTVSFNGDLADGPTHTVSVVSDLLKLLPGVGGLIGKAPPAAVLGVVELVPTLWIAVTEAENDFKIGEIPDPGQCAKAAWKIFDWINNDNNRVALLIAVSDKLGLGWDTTTMASISSQIGDTFLITKIAEVINDQMIFIGKYALGDIYGSVVITGSSDTGVTSTTSVPSTSSAPTTVGTSIVTSSSQTTFTIPQLVAPNDGITLQTNQNTIFRWSNTGATRYKFEVWNDTNKMNYSFDVNGTSAQFAPVSEGSWRWQVRSYSSSGQPGDAPYTRSFKVVSAPSQPSNGIALYDGPNYTGPFTVLTIGKYSNLADYSWSDRIESIRFLGDYSNNYHVVLYSEKDFSGDPGHYDADASTLGNAQQNHVRSVEIYRKTPGSGIELYDGQNFSGTCVFLPVAYPEGKYADLTTVGFWDRAESIKFVGDCAGGKCHAVLFSEKDFQGDPAHFDNDATTLPNAQQNHVRSVSLYMHQPPGPPTNPNPASGTVLGKISNSLDVSFDADGDDFQIHVWCNNFDRISDWGTSRSMHLDGLVPGQTYYWQAQGKNNIGVSPLSPQWSFTTAPLPTPSAPSTTTTVPPTTTPTQSFLYKWGAKSSTNDGEFDKPFGVAVDAAGNTFVVDTNNNRVQKFDSTGVFITKWGTGGSGDGQFNSPQGIAVDASGNVYVADTYNNRVQKFSSSGAFLTKWGSHGTGDGQFAFPKALIVDAGSNIYVVDTENNRIQKFSSSGVFIANWGTGGSSDGQLNYPQGASMDVSGNIYVVDYNTRVQKFTAAGVFLTKWGAWGTGDGQFSWPSGIAVDQSGNVYVTDWSYSRIQKFSSSGTFISKWGSIGTGDGQFIQPESLAVDVVGNIYVADTINNRIQKFSSSGAFISKFGINGLGDGLFNSPDDVALDTSGNVYVVDNENSRIQKFSSSGAFITKWGSFGTGDGQFWYPSSIALDSAGNVYVADTQNRIQKFDSSGVFITKWGSRGTGDGQFTEPTGIAVDSSNNIYVVDGQNKRVQKFSSSGTFLAKWGTSGTGDGQFNMPMAITIDSSDNVYVADTLNNRIQKFSNSGTFVTKWGTSGSGDGQFQYLYGIAADSGGNIYVSDWGNNRIQKFSSSGVFITKWGAYGSGDGQFYRPFGLAVDTTGKIFVADTGNNRIQVFGVSVPRIVANIGGAGNITASTPKQ